MEVPVVRQVPLLAVVLELLNLQQPQDFDSRHYACLSDALKDVSNSVMTTCSSYLSNASSAAGNTTATITHVLFKFLLS
jgi:hypothetical protein